MSEIDIVKIIFEVLLVFHLLMSLLLYLDYKIDGKYDIEFDITEFEDMKIEKDIMIRFITKVKEVVCINDR